MQIFPDHVYTLDDGKQVLIVRWDRLNGIVYFLPKLPSGFNSTVPPMKLPEKVFLTKALEDRGPSDPADLLW